MAVVDGVIYSNDLNMLTLTEEEYERIPEAKNYLVCVTESRMMVRLANGVQEYEKLPGLLASVHEITGSGGVMVRSDKKVRLINGDGRHNDYECGTRERDSTPDSRLRWEELGNHVKHLWSDTGFIASAIRNHSGAWMLTPQKITKCAEYHGHLLAEYDSGTHLVLLCYSDIYNVQCDLLFPSPMTKSARN